MKNLFLTLLLCSASICLFAEQQFTLENTGLRIELDPSDGSVRLTDKNSGEPWTLGPPRIVLTDQSVISARPSGKVKRTSDTLSFGADRDLLFRLRLRNNPPAVEYSFVGGVQAFTGPEVQEVQLLHQALPIGPGGNDYYVVPQRMGVLLRADGGKPFTRRLRAYQTRDGYSMAMFGAVKNGSAILATWNGPSADLLIKHTNKPEARLCAGLALRHNARSVRLQPLGRGGYVEIAKAYRPIAQQKGFLKLLADRLSTDPQIEKMAGAAIFKPMAYIRRVPSRRNTTGKEIVSLNFTFEECARLAEHYRNDLDIDRASLTVRGWMTGGYDGLHPDILPAAPELGGNEALADCSRRVKSLGWLFGLHDNYQDIYLNAPSWNPEYVVKHPDGSLSKGGIWAGGQCYLICSRKALELARRPQNLPGVRKLFSPTSYFVDCIFANPPRMCFDPRHPVSKAEDIQNKQQLCDYVHEQFGIFGSEEGYEWGVAHADYFEGMLSHKTGSHRPGRSPDPVIPIFEIVYGDSVPIYTHQADTLRPDRAPEFLDHVLYAEMPVYYFGNHLYWTDPAQDFPPEPGSEYRLLYSQGSRFGLIDQFIKNTYEVLSPLHRLTALLPMTDHRFVTPDRSVESTRFGDSIRITVNYGETSYAAGGTILPRYGFLIESPRLVAFCARQYGGMRYSEPTLFVIRSLDEQPLAASNRVRIYRGFGGHRIRWRDQTLEVETEKVFSPNGS